MPRGLWGSVGPLWGQIRACGGTWGPCGVFWGLWGRLNACRAVTVWGKRLGLAPPSPPNQAPPKTLWALRANPISVGFSCRQGPVCCCLPLGTRLGGLQGGQSTSVPHRGCLQLGRGLQHPFPGGARRLPLVPQNLLVPAGYSGAFPKGRAEKQTEILPGLLAGPERLWLDVRRLLAAMFCSAGALGRRRKGNGADTVPVEDSEGFTQGRGS